MASAAEAGAVPPLRVLSPGAVTALLLLAAALIIRAPRFGDPNLHVDEIFYLQVGDLMWKGALPFVDVWDRKPIGLFLLFATIRLLGGDGIVQYQIVATLFAFGTALIVAQLARRLGVSAFAAGAAGVAYLAGLAASGGDGGQSPVFYNLFVAGSAFFVLRASDAPNLKRMTVTGAGAMLLCGLAIQIKYTALFEGCFLGLFLVWRTWKSFGLPAAIRSAILFGSCGIGPTATAVAYYAAIGELHAFWFSNFTSIGLRPPTEPITIVKRLFRIVLTLAPLLACAAASFASFRERGLRPVQVPDYGFVLGWLGAAWLGFLLLGTFYWHYALPLLVPLTVAAAPIFDRRRIGRTAAALVILWGAVIAGFPKQFPWESQRQISEITSAVTENLNGGCVFTYDGPPAVDYLSGACHLTPYIFPYHLSLEIEETGLGVDPLAELRRVLDSKPTVIVSSSVPVMAPNRQTRALLYETLERDYRLVGSYRAKARYYQVYALPR